MAATSRRSSKGTVFRSLSPSGRFCNSVYSSPSTPSSSRYFASSSSSFSSRSSSFFSRSASPTRVNLYNPKTSASSSVRFSLDPRSISPNRSVAPVRKTPEALNNLQSKPQRRFCMCSPTTHPGSFRCSFHKGFGNSHPYPPNCRLNARRSAMTNSLVRIGGVEGELVKRALATLIRPSSHQQRRRADFQPRPSRLSSMSKAEDA